MITHCQKFFNVGGLLFLLHSASLATCSTGTFYIYKVEGVTGYQVLKQTRTGLVDTASSASTMASAEVFYIVYLL